MTKRNHNYVDLTGMVFCRWTVLGPDGHNKWGEAMWVCRCACGTVKSISGKNLRKGISKSCGCLRSELNAERNLDDISGRQIWCLYVNGIYGKDGHNQYIYEATCRCGKKVYATRHAILSGKTKSCGCWQREITSKRSRIDISGIKCGLLTPKHVIGTNKYNSAEWYCDCECGGHTIATTHMLLSGKVMSCGCLKSRNERKIAEWLDNHNIYYARQKTFDGCKNINPLRFDFYLPMQEAVIEYDGEFHYQQIENLNNDVEYQQNNDRIKDQYCVENNIRVLRIPYWEKDNIESILTDWLFLNDDEEANSPDASHP